jgi:hypothetical protein
MTLSELNHLPVADAQQVLLQCCGSRRWVKLMTARRPFATTDELLHAADELARELTQRDWLEAFAAHPRIRGSASAARQRGRSRSRLRR